MGRLIFGPGVTTMTISVPIVDDTTVEADEIFFVNLSNPSGASIFDSQGIGFIPNDDTANTFVDILLLFDDTGSFAGTAPNLATAFPMIVSNLATAIPTGDFAYGVARFEDFSTGVGDRPFILNQPILSTSDPQFSAAIDSALMRNSPGVGGSFPESLLEGLFQAATGVGFDGNGDGDSDDSGPAGLVSTQVMPGTGGDVPAFSTFMPDPTGPVVTASGTEGGAGFRTGSQRIILLATDASITYFDDMIDPITGVGGVTVPAANITVGGSATAPAGAAGIQQTIDAVLALGAQVIGLGDSFATNPATAPRSPLEAISILTGAINTTSMPLASGIMGDDIDPGEPLYFTIDINSGDAIATAITTAVLSAVTVPPLPPPSPAPPPPPEGNDTIIGGTGNDTLLGGNESDTIIGGTGDDVIEGGAGDDDISGGTGNDIIEGGDGNDTLAGESGDDTLGAGTGNDTYVWTGQADGNDILSDALGFQTLQVDGDVTANSFTIDQNVENLRVSEGAGSITINSTVTNVIVNGGEGDDAITLTGLDDNRPLLLTVNGDDGNDVINASGTGLGSIVAFFNGNDGNDTISGSITSEIIDGGADDDSVDGNAGNDTIFGDSGNDTINGGSGADSVEGGTDSDSITGGDDNDTLMGDSGDDFLNGDAGDDIVEGGSGNDIAIGSFGNDIVRGGTGDDGVLGGAGDDSISGGTGNDFIRGHSGNDQIKGGDGDDTIRADQGDDVINAGDGHDSIEGGDGLNIIDAGDGNDTVIGGRQADTILGGDGNDLLIAGGGRDSVYGGDGDDTLRGNGSSDRFNSGEGDDDRIADLAGVEFDDLTLAISNTVLNALAELDSF